MSIDMPTGYARLEVKPHKNSHPTILSLRIAGHLQGQCDETMHIQRIAIASPSQRSRPTDPRNFKHQLLKTRNLGLRTARTRPKTLPSAIPSSLNGDTRTSSLLSCYQTIGKPHPQQQTDSIHPSDTHTPSNNAISAPRTAQPSRPRNGPSRPPVTPNPPTVITCIPEHIQPSILLNALLLLDKPQDWQASEVVTTLKWATKAPHVIHLGSLDAMASGLLVVAFGEAARLTPSFNVMSKRYKGTVTLGLATETCDCTGKGTEVLPWKSVTGECVGA